MMNKLFLALAFLCVNVHAEGGHHKIDIGIDCFDFKFLTKRLKSDFEEVPVAIGKSNILEDAKAYTVFFANVESGTYTIIVTDSKTGCVLDSGDKIKFSLPKSLKNSM